MWSGTFEMPGRSESRGDAVALQQAGSATLSRASESAKGPPAGAPVAPHAGMNKFPKAHLRHSFPENELTLQEYRIDHSLPTKLHAVDSLGVNHFTGTSKNTLLFCLVLCRSHKGWCKLVPHHILPEIKERQTPQKLCTGPIVIQVAQLVQHSSPHSQLLRSVFKPWNGIASALSKFNFSKMQFIGSDSKALECKLRGNAREGQGRYMYTLCLRAIFAIAILLSLYA